MVERFLINRQFARVWLAGTISWVGDFVFDTTVLLWISTVLAKDQPWAPAAASGVMLAVLIPGIVVGPLAGVFVDRWDPRRTMLGSDALQAVLAGGLAVLPLLPAGLVPVGTQLVVIYAVVVLGNVVAKFFTPARFTIIADIVDEADQPRAASISQATSAAAGIIGPPLAAPLLFVAGVHWALLLNALSFVSRISSSARYGRLDRCPLRRLPRIGRDSGTSSSQVCGPSSRRRSCWRSW